MPSENTISEAFDVGLAPLDADPAGVNGRRCRLRKGDLRRLPVDAVDEHVDVDVRGSAAARSVIDRRERHLSVRVGDLVGVTAPLEEVEPPVVELGLVGELLDVEHAAVNATGMLGVFFIFRLYRTNSGNDAARV